MAWLNRAELPELPGLLGRFATVGTLSVGSDVVVLYVLHSVLGVDLLVATGIGYLVSLAVNYSLNHRWVFGAHGEHRRRIVRYVALVVVNVGTTYAAVAGLTAVGVYYLLAKLVAIAVNAVVNFTSFRYWVFR
jgi:putative flippase GtrA